MGDTPTESKKCALTVAFPLRDFFPVEEEVKELGWDIDVPDMGKFDDVFVLDYSLSVEILTGADKRLLQLLTLIKLVPNAVLKGSVDDVDKLSVFINDFAWKLQAIAKIMDEKTQ